MAAEKTTVLVNRPPNITWHRLHINEVPVELADLPAAKPAQPGGLAREADVASFYAEEAFQNEFWETGMGPAAQQWLQGHAAQRLVIDVPAGQQVEEPVVVDMAAAQGANAVLLLDVLAHAGSRVHVAVHADSEGDGEGAVGLLVRIAADERADVSLTTLQTLDGGWKYLEDIGILEGDDAKVTVRQTVLGAQESYVGLGSNQVGDRNDLDVDVRYLGEGSSILDFNYAMRMRGLKGNCAFAGNGALSGSSSKVLRDTIDLVHGCKGSVGNENETVLLVNDEVRNKSLPVILCDEDDVQGNHGATIGHVNPSQLEYMQTRGLTVQQIEDLLTSAIYDYAAQHAVTAEGAAAVCALAEKRIGAIDDEEEGESQVGQR